MIVADFKVGGKKTQCFSTTSFIIGTIISFYCGQDAFSSCQEFFKFPCHCSSSVKVAVYLHSVPVMKAVIFADIILEPRDIVIYYSPLIKAVISLSVPLLSSLPLKPFLPSLSPLLPTYHFILCLIPLLTSSMTPLICLLLFPFVLLCSPVMSLCFSLFPLLSHLYLCSVFFSLSFLLSVFHLRLYSPIWFNK